MANSNFSKWPALSKEDQRLFRKKEEDAFTELQMAIREVTGGNVNPLSRHETLTKAEQKLRELHRRNDELHKQLNVIHDLSRGAPDGQAPGAWPGGDPYAPDFSPQVKG